MSKSQSTFSCQASKTEALKLAGDAICLYKYLTKRSTCLESSPLTREEISEDLADDRIWNKS